MAPLVSADGRTATCTTHGGTYQILFSRYPMVAAARRVVPAPARTGSAGLPTDDLAAIAQAAGQAGMAGSAPIAEVYGMEGVTCLTHPSSTAVAYCQTCRTPVCATCVFVFPGGIQLCPACASNPTPQISPKRKRLAWWSIGLAAWSVLALVGMFVLIASVGTKGTDAESMGAAFYVLSLLPAIVGIALGVGTFDRRLSTPAGAWIGVIGNGVVILIWVLLMILGSMK